MFPRCERRPSVQATGLDRFGHPNKGDFIGRWDYVTMCLNRCQVAKM